MCGPGGNHISSSELTRDKTTRVLQRGLAQFMNTSELLVGECLMAILCIAVREMLWCLVVHQRHVAHVQHPSLCLACNQ